MTTIVTRAGKGSPLTWDEADNNFTNLNTDKFETMYTATGTGAVERSTQSKLDEFVSVKDFGAIGDGVTDDTTAIQNAINSGAGSIYIPAGIYIVTSELVVKDGVNLYGSSCFWKRRTGYTYNGNQHTVIKYTGAGGANTCVIRVSEKPVGTVGTDFTTPGTDDLEITKLQDIHIDANGLAYYGWYIYRAGNNSAINNLTAEKAVSANFIMLGIYAANWGKIGSYESQNHGIIVGKDIYSWGGSAYKCFDFHLTVYTCNNGTSHTYVAGSGTAKENTGGIFYAASGSHIKITAEGNYGKGAIIGSNATGPVVFEMSYIEANGEAFHIEYDDYYTAPKVINCFNSVTTALDIAGQITIEAVTADGGPEKAGEWLVLENIQGGISSTVQLKYFEIVSNTPRFRYRNSTPITRFRATGSYRHPTPEGVFASSWFKGDATLSDTRSENGLRWTRSSAGVYNAELGDWKPKTRLTNCSTTSGSTTVTCLDTSALVVGQKVISLGGSQIQAGTTIASITDGTTFEISKTAASTASPVTLTFEEFVPFILYDANYIIALSIWGTTPTAVAVIHSKATTGFTIKTYSTTDFTTLVDAGKFIEVTVSKVA